MLTKEDYRGYLEEMMAQEKKAVNIYSESLSLTDDKNIKEALKNIYYEELEHVKIVEQLINILLS